MHPLKSTPLRDFFFRFVVTTSICIAGAAARAADVFARFKVVEPPAGNYQISIGAFIHNDPWQIPASKIESTAGSWSPWFDASKWPLHGKLDRSGGIAEWPAMKVTISRVGDRAPTKGCTLDVQLADRADEQAVVHSFQEKSESDTIAFLLPTPLREHAAEFETGSQMTARHLAWAKEATGNQPVQLNDFTFITALWGGYDPALTRERLETLRLLGFNIVGNSDPASLHHAGLRTYSTSWLYTPDPDVADKTWAKSAGPAKNKSAASDIAHYVVADEIQTLNFAGIDPARLNDWFRDYLNAHHVRDSDLPAPIAQIEYPTKAMAEKSLPHDADLPTRRLTYYAAKFGHYWSARQLRHTSDLIRSSFPGMKTETLPSDHGFFDAWGPPHIGMSYRMLDLFEVGSQRSVDQLSAEDWLGLNHMYGPAYTWTGAQSVEYFSAICRSAADEAPVNDPILQRALLTVSDDRYLQLKAYSALGQGVKSFFFWTFGPTYISTENYWSDLRSEYDGIVNVGRAIQQAEPVLFPAKPVRDPVAILYSVSHDIWHTDDPAAFVEKRLLWHALRHLHVQPDFLREEDVEFDKLKNYKVLYITDWCVSRAVAAKIDTWVKAGGILYLSAGACTRDEFYEPFVPPFAEDVWPRDGSNLLKHESHRYNERVDLPTIKPMNTATVTLNGATPFEVPVIGCQLPLTANVPNPIAHFTDGSIAGAIVPHGDGKVIALGFMPMLAYGQQANFQPKTLEEKWPDNPRRLINCALEVAHITPVAQCDKPVVDTSLLTGPNGSALILVNYTYQPIPNLTIDLQLNHPMTRATSTSGKEVHLEKTPTGVRLRLPLDWTDIILLK